MSNGFVFNVNTTLHITENMKPKLKQAQFILDTQIIKDSNYFIPMDTGMLRDSALSASAIGEGRVVWNTPYARRLYYNPKYNFSKDKNPNARGLWFEAAKHAHLNQWLQMAKNVFNS